MSEAPGYMTYKEAALIFSLLDVQEAGQAIQATVNYFLYGEVAELHGAAQRVFEIMQNSIEDSRVRYDLSVESGRRGAEKRWGKKE